MGGLLRQIEGRKGLTEKDRGIAMSEIQPAPALDAIAQSIFEIRGQRVMLDSDLAALYGVENRALIQAVKRNLERFPEDFMFQLSLSEWENLRSQFVISNLRSQNGTSKHGGRRYAPYVFTEHGALMLSTVLKSAQAIEISHVFASSVIVADLPDL